MRALAAALLLLGFGWLSAQQIGLYLAGPRPGLRVLLSQLDSKPKTAYTSAEVEQLARDAVTAQFGSSPAFVLPGCVMLVGGVLGLSAGRRRRIESAP